MSRPSTVPSRSHRRDAGGRWRRLLLGFAVAGLAGCGGGITIGFGGGFDNSPPSVSLASSAGSVRAGERLQLIAAAADENGIDEVIFYRFDGGVATALGSRSRPPYEIDTFAPQDGRRSMVLFARAFDNAGNPADSERVTVLITP
jgi:hypothetical protein